MSDAIHSMLVIDDEQSICFAFERFFTRRGWQVRTAATARQGLSDFETHRPEIVFLDVRLPDRDGLELLDDLVERDANVVMITAYGGLETIIKAVQGKARDHLAKPVDLDCAQELADRIVGENQTESDTQALTDVRPSNELLVGTSPAMQDVYKQIARAAQASSPVLIRGETGTGKELAAIAIHRFSPRGEGPFVAINCGAIPENLIESELFGHVKGAFTGADTDRMGKFETAQGGTIFLDEIGDLPLAMQVKLLRVLDGAQIERVGSSESIRLDVRICAATHQNLEKLVQHGGFRQDLYYRLAVFPIFMPAVREHREDIPQLVEHFLQPASPGRSTSKLSDSAAEYLLQYDWPGNVRELRNVIHQAHVASPDRLIQPADLPETIRTSTRTHDDAPDRLRAAAVVCLESMPDTDDPYRQIVEHVERALITHAMQQRGGNQSVAATDLGLHRNTLRNKLRDLNIPLGRTDNV